MTKKYLISGSIIVIIILAGYLITMGISNKKPIVNAPSEDSDLTPSSPSIPEGSSAVPSGETGEKDNLIIFSDTGFSPAILAIKAGDTVTFKNESDREVWPASALHPTHNAYPVKDGCIGSVFDSCRGLKKGEEWSFKFDAPGAWGYHDHLNASFRGQIKVEE